MKKLKGFKKDVQLSACLYEKIKDKMGLNTSTQTNDQQVKPQIYKWMQNMHIPYLIAKINFIYSLKLNLHVLEMNHDADSNWTDFTYES